MFPTVISSWLIVAHAQLLLVFDKKIIIIFFRPEEADL